MIETRRLLIRPLSYDELLKHITSPSGLAEDLGLKASESLIEKDTQEAILNDMLPHLSDSTKESLFYTMWIMIEKYKRVIIGGICFHGEPDDNGEVEIGYGTDLGYRNRGYMTETISGMTKWAKDSGKIKAIKAETNRNNVASISVLEKNKFEIIEQKKSSVVMKLKI